MFSGAADLRGVQTWCCLHEGAMLVVVSGLFLFADASRGRKQTDVLLAYYREPAETNKKMPVEVIRSVLLLNRL